MPCTFHDKWFARVVNRFGCLPLHTHTHIYTKYLQAFRSWLSLWQTCRHNGGGIYVYLKKPAKKEAKVKEIHCRWSESAKWKFTKFGKTQKPRAALRSLRLKRQYVDEWCGEGNEIWDSFATHMCTRAVFSTNSDANELSFGTTKTVSKPYHTIHHAPHPTPTTPHEMDFYAKWEGKGGWWVEEIWANEPTTVRVYNFSRLNGSKSSRQPKFLLNTEA